jgi:hypothetical protein
MLVLENDRISISFHEKEGCINSIVDKQKQLNYMPHQLKAVPFRVEIEGTITSEFQDFSYKPLYAVNDASGYIFTWQITPLLKIIAVIKLGADSHHIRFECELHNHSEQEMISLEYPIIPNLGQITANGRNDYFAHSFATGVQIHNPMSHFTKEWEGFRFMPYPEGFSGSTMQFFSYYGQGKGGLYFATYDGESYSKWLNFYKNENELLEASFIHGCEDIGPQKSLIVPYPVVVQLLEGENWYEAADIYKEWAVNQYWCRNGLLSDVDEKRKSTWLMEEVGVSTFGINAGYDRAEWFKKYHEHIETKMFHILGPDWPQKTQDFKNSIPGGIADWFPTKFNKVNLEVIKSFGDKYAPFEFDYLFNINGADGENGKKALQKIPKTSTKSIDQYNFPFVCPADSYVQELHVRRDEKLQVEVNVDSIYYDISANNIMKVCMDKSHGHTKGAGRQITMAYRQNYINTKEAMIVNATGRYIPMGTEMMNEVFLDVLDYYQARAGGQPAAPLEGWNIRELLKSGDAELIPMFTYVYHEYGEVRLDGWGKVVEEIGDLFYFTVARTYLWGGLYELNYEYSPMEMINGIENSPDEHYYPYEPRNYQFSPQRAQFISKFTKLRTGVGNKYLAYGKMLKPLDFECETVKLDWFQYNCDRNFKEYNDSGVLEVKSIVHSAWQFGNESIGLFFSNVSDKIQKVNINLMYIESPLLNRKQFQVRILVDGEKTKSFEVKSDEDRNVEFLVPAKGIVTLEVN